MRKDGSRFLANLVITAARDSAGTLIGFSEISRDISDRKETEASTADCWRRRRTRWSWWIRKAEIVLLNVQAEKQFGYRRDELLGQKVTAIIPEGFAERLIADGTRSAADALAQQIGTGIELSARRKDGSEFPIEIMLSPLESKRGNPGDRGHPRHQRAQRRGRHLAQMRADTAGCSRRLRTQWWWSIKAERSSC